MRWQGTLLKLEQLGHELRQKANSHLLFHDSTRVGPGWNQESNSISHIDAGVQALGPSTVFPGTSVGNWVESGTARTQTYLQDIGVPGSGLTHCTTAPGTYFSSISNELQVSLKKKLYWKRRIIQHFFLCLWRLGESLNCRTACRNGDWGKRYSWLQE